MIRNGRLVAETSLDEFTRDGGRELRVRGADLTGAGDAAHQARGGIGRDATATTP